jgi:hypothetical protein
MENDYINARQSLDGVGAATAWLASRFVNQEDY